MEALGRTALVEGPPFPLDPDFSLYHRQGPAAGPTFVRTEDSPDFTIQQGEKQQGQLLSFLSAPPSFYSLTFSGLEAAGPAAPLTPAGQGNLGWLPYPGATPEGDGDGDGPVHRKSPAAASSGTSSSSSPSSPAALECNLTGLVSSPSRCLHGAHDLCHGCQEDLRLLTAEVFQLRLAQDALRAELAKAVHARMRAERLLACLFPTLAQEQQCEGHWVASRRSSSDSEEGVSLLVTPPTNFAASGLAQPDTSQLSPSGPGSVWQQLSGELVSVLEDRRSGSRDGERGEVKGGKLGSESAVGDSMREQGMCPGQGVVHQGSCAGGALGLHHLPPLSLCEKSSAQQEKMQATSTADSTFAAGQPKSKPWKEIVLSGRGSLANSTCPRLMTSAEKSAEVEPFAAEVGGLVGAEGTAGTGESWALPFGEAPKLALPESVKEIVSSIVAEGTAMLPATNLPPRAAQQVLCSPPLQPLPLPKSISVRAPKPGTTNASAETQHTAVEGVPAGRSSDPVGTPLTDQGKPVQRALSPSSEFSSLKSFDQHGKLGASQDPDGEGSAWQCKGEMCKGSWKKDVETERQMKGKIPRVARKRNGAPSGKVYQCRGPGSAVGDSAECDPVSALESQGHGQAGKGSAGRVKVCGVSCGENSSKPHAGARTKQAWGKAGSPSGTVASFFGASLGGSKAQASEPTSSGVRAAPATLPSPGVPFGVYDQGTYKTELCNKWEEMGSCPYGPRCQFAHGVEELRPVLRHPQYKTELCRMVAAGKTCPYGHRCHFRHSRVEELKATTP